MNIAELKNEFTENELEWRVQQSGKRNDGTIWAKIVPYISNRAIQDRLDVVCSPENWRNEYVFVNGGIICRLSIKIGEEWVTKEDGSEATDIEPFKGGLSNAMKRAAVQWGIGRYLYSWGESWAVISDKGDHSDKLKDGTYYKWSAPKLGEKQPEQPNTHLEKSNSTTDDKIPWEECIRAEWKPKGDAGELARKLKLGRFKKLQDGTYEWWTKKDIKTPEELNRAIEEKTNPL